MNANELREGLNQFYGTETWTVFSPLFPKVLLTEGALWLAESAGAYWLMDAIASYQPDALKDDSLREMQFWTLTVHECGKATLICERDKGDVVFTQEIEHTDFPLPEIKLWVGPLGEEGKYTILLPSEY